jgi:hypothetical protein
VKSAYKVCIDSDQVAHGSSNGTTVHYPTMSSVFPWYKIWELQCPNKVKIFAWRLAHNSLPMKRRIKSKGIELDTKCPMCLRLDEDAGHLLLKCKFARAVWQRVQMDDLREKLAQLGSGHDVFYAIWECKAVQMKLITILRVLWSEWNAVNTDERIKSIDKVCYQISQYISEFL